MSDREPVFKGSYPEPIGATLRTTVEYDRLQVGSGPSASLQLPDFYLKPGESVSIQLESDGRVTVKAFGAAGV